MSKLFINTIIQHGGEFTNKEKVSILDVVSKSINKKMKILEYKYGIQLKIERLPERNGDCLPKQIGIQGIAQFDGSFRGSIPYYTTTNIAIPTPTISTVTTGIPLTPFGPVIGVPSLAINPFGNVDRLDDRIKKATETLKKISELNNNLDELKNENKKMDNSNPLKKYFDYIDLNEPCNNEELEKILSNDKK